MKQGPRTRQRGAILLMAVLLLGVILVGLLIAGVLYLRELDQRRNLETRRRLEQSFQAIFPYPQARAGNLRKDFGFAPNSALALNLAGYKTKGWFLQALVDRSQVGALDATQNPPPLFTGIQGGWNGPYWEGALDAQNRPLDAWGRPIQFRWVTSPSGGWQVFSLGANGVDDSTVADSGTPSGDDLAYPMPPYVPPEVEDFWQKNGYTTGTATAGFTLTNTANDTKGSVLWTGLLNAQVRTIEFDISMGGGDGADGLALVFANADEGMKPTFLDQGYLGIHHGSWEGANGLSTYSYCVAFDTYYNDPNDPSASFVGFRGGGSGPDPTWLATRNYNGLRTYGNANPNLHVRVVTSIRTNGRQRIQVYMNNSNTATLTYDFLTGFFLPARAYIGFTGSTGGSTDYHIVRNITGIP